jgi:ribonuclease P protein component
MATMSVTAAAQTFGPERRFHHGRDFGRAFKRQQKAAGRHVVLLLAPLGRHDAPARLGIMVSTKTAALAVRRHQLKRWVRELFRTRLAAQLAGYDAVVLFRADPPEDGHRRLDEELLALVPKAIAAKPDPGGRSRGGPPRQGGGRR